MTFFQVGLALFFLNSICFAERVLVSLGENCNVAMALSQHGLRKKSLPFDWNVTPFHSLYHILSNDFANVLSPEYLFLNDDSHTVINRYYGIAFAHDFPTYDLDSQDQHDLAIPAPGVIKPDFLDALPNIQEKYQRRIKYLYNILNGDDEVLFIRHNHSHVSKSEVMNFYELIKSKFPKLNFTLVVWGYEDEMKEDWGHPRIKTYQMIRGKSVEAFYESLFRSLNLISCSSNHSKELAAPFCGMSFLAC